MVKGKVRVNRPAKANLPKITDEQKNEITAFFEPLILQFKKELKKVKPNKRFNYLLDIYTRWNKQYFYFCEKYKSEFKDRIDDEFEVKFVRMEFISVNRFNFSYFRHTGQWNLVFEGLKGKECLEMILGNPNFRPSF